MALICNIPKGVFYDALNALQNISSRKSTIAILANTLFESCEDGLFLTSTDLEVGIRIKIPAEIIEQGALTLPSKKIYEIVRESGSTFITIKETENSWVEIQAGQSIYNLAGLPSLDFPVFPEFSEGTFVSFEAAIFTELIDKVIFSIATEQENNYTLTSVLFEAEKKDENFCLRMISSDGHRLSIMEKKVDFDLEKLILNPITLIPKKGLHELKKFCENRDFISFSCEKEKMVIKDDNAVLIIALKEGEFPPYRAIINAVQLQEKIQIKRIPFLEALKRINLFTEETFHTIQLEITEGKIVLSSQNGDIGNAKDEQTVIYTGEPLLLGFNCRFFIETLQVMDGEDIDAYINSNRSPCLLKSDADEGFLSIIMPMQI